jgi:hypothetical protein
MYFPFGYFGDISRAPIFTAKYVTNLIAVAILSVNKLLLTMVVTYCKKIG